MCVQELEYRDSMPKTVYNWWLQYLTGLIGVSTLGASITFGVLTTSNTEPDALSGRFGSDTVRTFLAIAFLLFLSAIGCANLLFYLLFYHEIENFKDNKVFKRELSKWLLKAHFDKFLHFCNLMITSVMLTAFIMLALVIVAYTGTVGWITLAVVCVYAVIFIVLWCVQY